MEWQLSAQPECFSILSDGLSLPAELLLAFVFKTKSWGRGGKNRSSEWSCLLPAPQFCWQRCMLPWGQVAPCALALGGDTLTPWSPLNIWPNSCCLFVSSRSHPSTAPAAGRVGKLHGFHYWLPTHSPLPPHLLSTGRLGDLLCFIKRVLEFWEMHRHFWIAV